MAYPSTAIAYGQATIIAIITLLVFGWSTVALRLWVRLRITKSPGWDDAIMVLTLFLFTSYCAFISVIISRAHELKLLTDPAAILQTLLYVQLGEIFYVLTTTALKISLGLFFMRVLTRRWQINLFRIILAVSAASGLFYVCIVIFACGSPDKLALGLVGSKKCLPPRLIFTAGLLYGVINVIADWIFVLIPIWILVDSDMDRQMKISVSIVMAFGAIGSVSSVCRMVYLKGLQIHGAGITNDAVKATFWATAEPGTGIVAASMAILRPLFRNLKHGVQDRLSQYNNSKSGRSAATISADSSRIGKDNDYEGTIPLTLVTTLDQKKARASIHSIQSPTWDTDIELQQARVGQIIHVRMKSGPPTPPLKP